MAQTLTTTTEVVTTTEAILEVNRPSKASISSILPNILQEETFSNAHPAVKQLFSLKIPRVALAGRLKYFETNWEKLTHYREKSPEIN